MKENIGCWIALHRRGYFKTHPFYQGGEKESGIDLEIISQYISLHKKMNALIIGAGYGRDSALIAPLVDFLWSVDVEAIQDEFFAFMSKRRLSNYSFLRFTPGWEIDLPPIDFAYSVNVFQHLTRDLVREYFRVLARILREETGRALVQFCHYLNAGAHDADPRKIAEPAVNWTPAEIEALAKESGLIVLRLDSIPIDVPEGPCYHYWVYIRR